MADLIDVNEAAKILGLGGTQTRAVLGEPDEIDIIPTGQAKHLFFAAASRKCGGGVNANNAAKLETKESEAVTTAGTGIRSASLPAGFARTVKPQSWLKILPVTATVANVRSTVPGSEFWPGRLRNFSSKRWDRRNRPGFPRRCRQR